MKDRLMSASAYLFGIPALYIILTEHKRKKFLGYHGPQAFYLWLAYFVIFFGVRYLIDRVWANNYIAGLNVIENLVLFLLGGYTLYCAYRAVTGQIFRIPQ